MPLIDPAIGDTLIAPSTMKILGATDPSTPIPPAEITAVLDLFQNIQPLKRKDVVSIIDSALPTASDELVKSLISIAIQKRYVVDEPEPTTPVAKPVLH